jgi:ABC-type lipoprotein export system ATPase subunit
LAPLATPAVKHRAFELPLDKPVYQLSGGQKQLLAILMLLQKPTELLLLDEPTAALDPQRSTQLMQFLKTVAHERDIPVVMISHDQEITSDADAIYELRIESDNVRRLNLVVA